MIEQSSFQARELWFPFAFRILAEGTWARLSLTARAVYPAICLFADFETHECFPSLNKIAKIAGVGRRSVSRAVNELAKEGLLVRSSGRQKLLRQGKTFAKCPSNRYKIVEWPRVTVALSNPDKGHDGPNHRANPDSSLGSRWPSNNIHLSTTTITREPGGGDDSDTGLLQLIAAEFGIGRLGYPDLEELLDRYGADWLRKAAREAVSRGHATISYMRGILKKWSANGGPHRGAKKDAAAHVEQKLKDEAAVKAAASEEGRKLAEQSLAECSEEDIAAWREEAEQLSDGKKVPARLRDAWIKSKIVLKVAEKFGIEGV